MKTKFANLAMIVFIVGTVGFTDSDAAVYKWRDENGKVFFTDDPSKVPEEFRKKPLIKDFKTSNTTNKPSLATDKKNAKEDSSEPEKKEDGKSEGLTEAHRSTIQTAIGFLKEDISRYEKFYTWPASVRKFHHIKLAVAGVTPQKQDLSE